MATYKTQSWGSGWKVSKPKRASSSAVSKPAPGYRTICNTFSNKIAGYKFLTAQGTGAAKGTRPSPATLATFSRWIEKGAVIQKVTGTQVKKWAKSNQTFKSAASAKTVLQKRFGKTTIKAVTTSKTGGFLVATSPTWKGKAFKFPR